MTTSHECGMDRCDGKLAAVVEKLQIERDELRAERDAALARLAELEKQEPAAWLWVATCGSGTEQVRSDEPIRGFQFKRPLFTAAGASPQPSQARGISVEGKQPRLSVRLTSFPESNGKRNWTALLVRVDKWDGLVGNCGGVSLARGELWNRVAWEAECARFLIGERDTEPFILDYGDDIETPEKWLGETNRGRRAAINAKEHQNDLSNL